jgi:hypothetical protein
MTGGSARWVPAWRARRTGWRSWMRGLGWLERAQCELGELQNVIERSVIVCDSDQFSVDESWLSPRSSESGSKRQFQFSQKLAAHEKEMIESVLRETKGRIFGPSGAAAKLRMPASHWTPRSGGSEPTEIVQNLLAQNTCLLTWLRAFVALRNQVWSMCWSRPATEIISWSRLPTEKATK